MSGHVGTNHVAAFAVGFTDLSGDAQCENTFYFRDVTDNLFSDFATFASDVWTAWVANVIPTQTTDVVYNRVTVEDVRSVPFAGLDFPQTPTAGTIATGTTAMPNVNSFAIKRSAGIAGRSGRGRLYMPAWSNGLLSGTNSINPTVANNWKTALQAFQTAIEGATFPGELGIVSYVTGGSPRGAGLFEQITSWSYSDLTVDAQRRRLPGRGR